MRKLLALALSLMLAMPAFGATVYFAQTSAGGATGADCADAIAKGSVTWTAGNTYHICGTVSNTAGTTVIGINASGTSGNPITLVWENGAIVEAPYCAGSGSGGCIDLEGHSYITLNGGTNGIIEDTANGTGLTYQQASVAIQGNSSGNITIENLTIENIYVHTSASDSTISDSAANCIYDNGTANAWTIENNVMHDMSWCVNIQYNNSTGITINGNNIYNVDHGVALGGPAAGYTLSTVNIYGNNIHDYSNWDTAADSYHHDGVHIFGHSDNASDTITGVNIYNNTFGGCIGQNVTAHVFMEANAGGTSNVAIYGNSFIDTCAGNDPDGLLTTGVDSGYAIYNNTFIGPSTDTCVGTSSSPSIIFKNNVVSGCEPLMYITTGGGFAAGGLQNNTYANQTGSNAFSYLGTTYPAFSSWQTATGQDASPSQYVSSAGLNSAGQPLSGSAVLGVGQNLTSLSITGLDTDLLGIARPGSGNWTAGTYQNTAASSTGSQLSGGVKLTSGAKIQ